MRGGKARVPCGAAHAWLVVATLKKSVRPNQGILFPVCVRGWLTRSQKAAKTQDRLALDTNEPFAPPHWGI
jgi:hypothetical protein